MNKTTKGTIAVAAAIALLMGGAGSLAYWQDSASVDRAAVTTGQLDVDIATGCTWTVKGKDAAAASPIANIATFRMVPGDTVTCNVNFTTVATGDNLKADASIVWGDRGTLPAGMTEKVSGTYNSVAITGNTFAVAQGSKQGSLSFSLEWPFGAAGEQTAATMNKSIALSASTVTVAQK